MCIYIYIYIHAGIQSSFPNHKEITIYLKGIKAWSKEKQTKVKGTICLFVL